MSLAQTLTSLSIAARLALPEAPAGVVYRPLDPPRKRRTALAAPSFQRLSPAAAAFVEVARRLGG